MFVNWDPSNVAGRRVVCRGWTRVYHDNAIQQVAYDATQDHRSVCSQFRPQDILVDKDHRSRFSISKQISLLQS